jgi:hypothetical protein
VNARTTALIAPAELDGPVVLVCQAGTRPRTAHTTLAAAGAQELPALDPASPRTPAPGIRGAAAWPARRWDARSDWSPAAWS